MTEANKTKQARMQRVLEVWVDNPTCTEYVFTLQD